MESGPSFCLQTYILMVGQKKGLNIKDWNNIQKDEVGEGAGIDSVLDVEYLSNLSLPSLLYLLD